MLDKQQKDFIKNLIIEIYKIELIFQDLKINEININYKDTKFIIPNLNKLNNDLLLLKNITDTKIFDRIKSMIEKEANNTLIKNINNIDKVINYSYKVIQE